MNEEQINEHLGRQLRRRRRALGLTQETVAAACGLSFQQIQKYECGANRLSAAKLWTISRALNVAVNYFFEGLDRRLETPTATILPLDSQTADPLRARRAVG